MKALLFFMIFSCSLPENNRHVYMKVSQQCCSAFSASGECLEELVPGCASDSAPLFKEKFLHPDQCCEHWGKNGICYREKIKGCSTKKINEDL